jgi:DNA segregation ATPase FtsK/SpoIIIE-like protein
VLGNLTPGTLAYGVLPDGTLLTMPMARSYHVLASGDTRSGKSNLLDGIIVQAHHQARALNLRIVAMDVKREMSATWERSNLIETESDPAVILDYLREVLHGNGGILHRYDMFKAAGEQHGRVIKTIADYEGVTGERMGHWLIILDELSALFEGSKDKDKEDLVRILQMGAGAGCYILSGAQYITHDLLKRAGSKQFVTRAIFGSYDGTAVNMLFSGKPSDAHRALLTGQPGRGLIRTVGQVEPLAFQALHCTEADILSAITIGADDVLTMDHLDIGHAPATPQHHASTVSAPHMHAENQECSNEGGGSPEVRRMVWFLKEQKYNKERTIKAIWGCSKGSNEPYRRASQIYDQIVREGR